MIIRPATNLDLPEILNLSKQSLGEIEGKRTEEFWQWKHQQNPFGSSPVLLAFEKDMLIGVRAFLPWVFTYKSKSFQAYRAVDTATHPQYRGKGIFSTLTLKLIDHLQGENPAVIYNTPNEKSRPGYLKMGWKIAGKTRLCVKVFPWYFVQNRLGGGTLYNSSTQRESLLEFPDDMPSLLNAWMSQHQELVMTQYSLAYLQWRYRDVPVLGYQIKVKRQEGSSCVIIYRLRESKRLQELRITEIFYDGLRSKRLVRSSIQELAEVHRPDVITLLTDPRGYIQHNLPIGFFLASAKGLTITCRKLNDDYLAELALNQKEWYFSAGTLELF